MLLVYSRDVLGVAAGFSSGLGPKFLRQRYYFIANNQETGTPLARVVGGEKKGWRD